MKTILFNLVFVLSFSCFSQLGQLRKGDRFVQNGYYQEAIIAYLSYLKVDAKNASAHLKLAKCYLHFFG